MSDPSTTDTGRWQQAGAAAGLLSVALFVVGFLFFLSTDPSGAPELPDVASAEQAPAFIAANLDSLRTEVLFNTLGMVVFLWFLGSLLPRLRAAEGNPPRGSTVAAIGAIVGSVLVMAGFALAASSGLASSPLHADTVPGLYAASALLIAFGGGTLGLFFLGTAEVVLRTGVMARWLGLLTLVPAVLCLLAFMTPFFGEGALNAANGVLGRHAWFAAMVVWLLVVSATLTTEELRAASSAVTSTDPQFAATGGVG